MQPVITALIPSKNRPDLVNRLVESIRAQKLIEALEIIVVDDGSTVPLELADPDVLLVRNEKSLGACAARNRGFAAARGEFIILFDDDTQLCDPMMLQGAVDLARRHPEVGAIGFRQLMSNGVQAECQPADSCETCETSCFFGYGALLRRAAILQTRGFEESFVYNYEEQDLCMQLHQAGWRVLYAPELALLHHHDPRGRDWTKIHRLISRNAIRSMLLRFPIFSVLPCAVAKWLSFFVETGRRGKVDWSGGFAMFFDTIKYIPYAWRNRQPMAASTLVRYRRLRTHPIPLKPSAPQNAQLQTSAV